LLLLR